MPNAESHYQTASFQNQVDSGFRFLRFNDPLEQRFRERDFENGRLQLRIIIAAAILFGGLMVAIDYFVDGPGFRNEHVPLRAGILISLAFGLYYVTGSSNNRRLASALCIMVGLMIGVGGMLVNLQYPRADTGLATAGYVIVTFFIYFFLNLRFWQALITASLLCIAVIAANLFQLNAQWFHIAYLVPTNLMAATGLYNLEYSRRQSFLKELELEYLVSRDPLTGLANRGTIDKHLARLWRNCQRESKYLTVALIDIDHFKAYNDTYGHQQGDNCLRTIAQEIGAMSQRPLDMAARFGGEEFVLILPDCDARHAQIMMEDLRIRIFSLDLPHSVSETAPVVTVSVGIASANPNLTERSSTGLLQAADVALYKAKLAGRNTVVVAASSDLESMKTGRFEVAEQRAHAAAG